eukprot:2030042-Alexandrium_andersonii.AAC.1
MVYSQAIGSGSGELFVLPIKLLPRRSFRPVGRPASSSSRTSTRESLASCSPSWRLRPSTRGRGQGPGAPGGLLGVLLGPARRLPARHS